MQSIIANNPGFDEKLISLAFEAVAEFLGVPLQQNVKSVMYFMIGFATCDNGLEFEIRN